MYHLTSSLVLLTQTEKAFNHILVHPYTLLPPTWRANTAFLVQWRGAVRDSAVAQLATESGLVVANQREAHRGSQSERDIQRRARAVTQPPAPTSLHHSPDPGGPLSLPTSPPPHTRLSASYKLVFDISF